MKLTKRESILLTILMFVLLNVGVFGYVVLPMIPTYQQTKEEADALQLDLDMKLLLVESTTQLQQKNNALNRDLSQLKMSFLAEMKPEEIDLYLNDMIGPFSSAWQTLSMQSYQNVEISSDANVVLLSYVTKAEVQVQLAASETVMMDIMKKFQDTSDFIGIKDIQVMDGFSTFTIEFYAFNGNQAE